MEPINYHRATLNDINILTEYRVLFALELVGDQPEEKITALKSQMQEYFAKATADESCISIIATCQGQIAGIGSVHFRQMPGNFKNPSGKWGYIMNMYTVKAFRRRGICKKILELLIEEGKKKGVTAYELHATRQGESVYTQEGFIHHTEPTLRKFTEHGNHQN